MKLLKFLGLAVFVVPSLLIAQEPMRAQIASHPVTEQAAFEIEDEKEDVEEIQQISETAGYAFDRYPPIYYSSSYHWLEAIVVDNNAYTLELEDGSVWKISNYDGAKAVNWRQNDPLTITQNSRWFSKYNYRIINKINGSSVEANLFLAPILADELDPMFIQKAMQSRFILAIDFSRRELTLNDNTQWEISYLDGSIFKDWSQNDYIIIGTNSNTSIWDSGSDALLINVRMNNCARAKQF